MYTTALREIFAFIFGRKYYANIVRTRGVLKDEMCSYIFSSPEEARAHRDVIENETDSFRFVATISFRSRRDLVVASYTNPDSEKS
jgi:hypothetical protein